MVDEDIVLKTVKRMVESGLDDSTIRDTLADIGLEEEKIAAVIAAARGSPSLASNDEVAQEAIAERAAEKVRERLDEERNEKGFHDTAAAVAMESHGQKLAEMHEDVQRLHKRFQSLPVESAEANKKVAGIEKELAEIKAGVNALQGLLQKVLETNRDILVKLERKKE